jgi:diguanylate cyclase (GGDEF)-like protein
MLKYVLRYGVLNVVIVITFITVLLSAVMTMLIFLSFGELLTRAGIFSSIIIPLIIAPIVTLYLASAVLESHILKEKMYDLATIDQLTGVKNRRAFMEAAISYYKIAVRNNHIFSVVLLDLDHFKKINDTFGHLVGDEVLRSIGNVFCKSVRTSDIAGRYGGEEFMFILPEVGRESVKTFTDKLHEEISDTCVDHNGSKVNVTVSIGVAIYDTSNDAASFENLLDQSDKMLYKAKRKGRNCTVIN